uniref:Uncharacterized protein n=1 Tax=Anopheles funestus TaxID=62324 RepID=A0A182S355_ANOFN
MPRTCAEILTNFYSELARLLSSLIGVERAFHPSHAKKLQFGQRECENGLQKKGDDHTNSPNTKRDLLTRERDVDLTSFV